VINTENNSVHYKSESTLFFVIKVFIDWRRFIGVCVLISFVLSVAVALLLPVKYRSSASVFPAEKADLLGSLEGISSLAKNFSSGKGLASLRGDAELDRYLAILKSDRVLRKVIDQFDLVHVYNISSYPLEKTKSELLDNVEFSTEPEGNLVITVYDEDPKRAAEMANYFVDELNSTNSELQALNAKANRRFIEERYQKNLVDLARSEESLKVFQKHYGVIAMPQQTEATVKAGAEFAAQLATKEIQLRVEERTQSHDHPSVIALRIEIEELKKKISSMNKVNDVNVGEMKFLVPFASIPDLGSEYLRRFREVETQYKILQFITPLFEQSKVEEQRQTPSVLVLDRAYPAERKSKPKRSLVVLGGVLVGLLSSFGYVGVDRWWVQSRERATPLYGVLRNLFDAVASDAHRLRTKLTRRGKGRAS
jgi:tyrosine-protein kinase Etk/Wzc